ncbi:tyrosine-type recombinase/integrase [Streptomyces sp. NPDC046237]|uniref:tyrosine-type recombinase/integrase n=1 Tax=Streptomyces sp. NPDC046237 TaxID=3154914 RepID=UPI0033F06277
MFELQGSRRDLADFVLPETGRLVETGKAAMPYVLLDGAGAVVGPAELFFAELQACGRPASTLRSYGMDLLRWWRWLSAWEVEWDRAGRADARDFARWMQMTRKPTRVHWRHRRDGAVAPAARSGPAAVPNPVTGRAAPGLQYAASTRAHCETVLRTFYDFHLSEGAGPLVNPFPQGRRASGGPAGRAGQYRPSVPWRQPRRIPDGGFNDLFAALRSNRDRALLAFWVSNGARAEELLSSRQRDVLPGEQLLGVVRKGTRAYQQLPSSADAFVWLRLYQEEAWAAGVPRGPGRVLWWTLRRPFRPLTYHAARAMLERANALLGANWTLHDLRHTAAYRLARDPAVALTDVQWVLGHAHLTTTQLYLPAGRDEVIESVREHHLRQIRAARIPAVPAPGYRPETLNMLFGTG